MFIHAEHTVVIHRLEAEVFALVSDPTQEPLWNTAVLKIEQLSEKPAGIGTIYRETHHVVLRQNTMTIEVVNYQPNQQFGTRSISGDPLQTHLYILEPHTQGTSVTLKDEVKIPAILCVLAPLLRRIGHEEIIKGLTQLKQFLEN